MKYIVNSYGKVKTQKSKKSEIEIVTPDNIDFRFKKDSIIKIHVSDQSTLLVEQTKGQTTAVRNLHDSAAKVYDSIIAEIQEVKNASSHMSKMRHSI